MSALGSFICRTAFSRCDGLKVWEGVPLADPSGAGRGIVGAIWGAGTGGDVFILLAGLAARVIGTCAVFYTLFLCRMLGAGDIKLMALCTGLLGMGPGLLVIFTGLFLAALRAAG